jgi:methylenetetrahydrofolate dehydrogenase (NADP+)/methenyltetrahydrofolate cyclohydrolase
MSAKILDGRKLAAKIKLETAAEITAAIKEGHRAPGLDVILVGSNPASASYVHHKQTACNEVGIRSRIHHLPETATQKDIESLIFTCNNDDSVDGILLQLPLPAHIESDDLLEKISPRKDVDGFHPYNLGRLTQRRPCTPYGVMLLLQESKINFAGKHAVVVGASNIVGRPMALELLLAKATVTVCHRFTKNLASHVQDADILIVATGKPGLVQSDWIKPGSVVVDVGFSRLSNGKIVGDLDYETAALRADWITPVPGGVGPMTVATLMKNTLMCAKLARDPSLLLQPKSSRY